jgi:hypothetical protein
MLELESVERTRRIDGMAVEKKDRKKRKIIKAR